MEQTLVLKMQEFMIVLDQVKKYKALLSMLPDFAVIIALSIIGWQLGEIIPQLGMVFINKYQQPALMDLVQISILVIGAVFAVFWVNRKMKLVKVGQWKNTLNEGTPGAIKLLQDLKWDEAFKDIRHAKLGFALYGVAKVLIYWFTTAFVFTFIGGLFLNAAIHANIAALLTTLNLLALVVVLFLSRKDLQKRYEQVGRLDALLWELRWFDHEFRRADFKT